MADFNVDAGQPQLTARPIQPVQDNSVAQGLNTLGNLFADTGKIAKSALVNGAKAQADAGTQHVLGEIQQNLIAKADVKDQIGWSTDRALRAVRRQFSSDIANHPELTQEINAVYKSTLAERGLGGNLMDQSQAEKDAHAANTQVFNAMLSSGMVNPDLKMDSPEGKQAMDTFQQYQLQQTNLAAASKQLAYKRAQIGYQSDVVQLASAKQSYVTGGITQNMARLNLSEKQAEVQSRAAITAGAGAANQLLSQKMSGIYEKFKSGQLSPGDATVAIDQEVAKLQGVMNSAGPNAGGDYIRNVTAPMVALASTLKESITGKIDATSAQNAVQATTDKMTMMQIHNNPEILPIISMSNALRNMPPAVMAKMTDDAFKMVGFNTDNGTYSGATDPTKAFSGPNYGAAPSASTNSAGNVPVTAKPPKVPDYTANSPATKGALGFVRAGMDNVLSGANNTPETIHEINNQLDGVVKSVNKYGGTVDNPGDLYDVMKTFASPTFAKYLSSGHYKMTQGENDDIVKVLQTNYIEHALPIIRSEYLTSSIATGEKQASGAVARAYGATEPTYSDTAKIISPTFNGSGVTFVANDPNSYEATQKASKLNKDLSKTLNLIINARANLSGTTPKAEYEKLYDQIFPEKAAVQ